MEENLRRVIHSRFLVPDGTIRMIESLKYAHYEPRASLLSSLSESRRAAFTQTYRLRRTRFPSLGTGDDADGNPLRQLGTGAPHPLDSKAFEPFAKDFDAIEERYRFLEQQVDALDDLRASGEQQASLGRSAETLLRRIYAYINWGIRHKANTEGEVTQTLEDLGFAVPTIGNRRIFDIVFPAAALIFIITMFFWTTVDGITHLRVGGVDFTDSILRNMNAAFQASLMYGGAVLIALVLRDKLIQRMEWRGTSIKGYVSIAVWAGFTTWAVITLTSAGFELRKSGESVLAWGSSVRALAFGAPFETTDAAMFLPTTALTAAPWLLAGIAASFLLARLTRGSVHTGSRRKQLREAALFGLGLGIVAAMAQMIQLALMVKFGHSQSAPPWGIVPLVGLAGAACGAAIGATVPRAFRSSLTQPFDVSAARTLDDLLKNAERTLGSREDAERWLFSPHRDLGGITPAEAVHTEVYSTKVPVLLENAGAQRNGSSSDRGARPGPVLVGVDRKIV